MNDFENLDTITLQNDQIVFDLIEWADHQDRGPFNVHQLPLESGKILISGKLELLYLSVENTIFFLYLDRTSDIIGCWILKKDTNDLVIADNPQYSKFLASNPDRYVAGYFKIWKHVMLYLLRFKKDTDKIDISEQSIKKRTTGAIKKNRKRKSAIVYLNKRNYNIKPNITRKKVNWSIDSWGVRGHFRKLKNGKEIYVRPYVKGKGNKEAKDYRI